MNMAGLVILLVFVHLCELVKETLLSESLATNKTCPEIVKC